LPSFPSFIATAHNASDNRILQVIQAGLKEEADELAEQGFTWATADTRIAGKLLLGGYLNRKGRSWGKPGGSVIRHLARVFWRE
jgi:hypothetical protein